jgi:septum formation protein
MNHKYQLVLSSKSPRRQQIMKDAGFSFEIRTLDTDESYPETLEVKQVPIFLAEKKAKALESQIKENELIVTADTLVILENKILSKPESKEDAKKMLLELSGKMHLVITGVCFFNKSTQISFDDVTEVYFRKLNQEQIHYYVETFNPMDKAGSYGIQEWIGLIGVEKINGSYFNVMGLPIHKVYETLQKIM